MRLNDIFADHMVFAAGKEIRVFGTGDGHARVEFGGQRAQAQSENGRWIVRLAAMEAGGPHEMRVALNGEEMILRDIYIGKVYLVAGQSNVQFRLKDGAKEIRVAPDPMLRSFFLKRPEIGDRFAPKDGWILAVEDTLPDFSMLGALVGQEMRASTGEAVANVCCYQGASGILSWLPKEYPAQILEDQLHFDYHYEVYKAWNGQGMLYENMFAKLCPFSFSGVIWYQGESDTAEGEAEKYEEWLSDMIAIWRKDLQDDELFFAIIQIADNDGRMCDAWRRVQSAQANVGAALPRCATVISRDVCDSADIHPADKRALAIRTTDALSDN